MLRSLVGDVMRVGALWERWLAVATQSQLMQGKSEMHRLDSIA